VHAVLWAGDDVHYVKRPGQVIPDPPTLAQYQPRNGQKLTEFPEVFPTLWTPHMGKQKVA
jgi:hypothetical protein